MKDKDIKLITIPDVVIDGYSTSVNMPIPRDVYKHFFKGRITEEQEKFAIGSIGQAGDYLDSMARNEANRTRPSAAFKEIVENKIVMFLAYYYGHSERPEENDTYYLHFLQERLRMKMGEALIVSAIVGDDQLNYLMSHCKKEDSAIERNERTLSFDRLPGEETWSVHKVSMRYRLTNPGYDVFTLAARTGDLAVVQRLLAVSDKVDLPAVSLDGARIALAIAAENGNLKMFKALSEQAKLPSADMNILERKVVVNSLQRYISDVEENKAGEGIDFGSSFRFMKDSKAMNRKINYFLAKELLTALQGDTPEPVAAAHSVAEDEAKPLLERHVTSAVSDIFSDVSEKRATIAKRLGYGGLRSGRVGSTELREIINFGESLSAESSPGYRL